MHGRNRSCRANLNMICICKLGAWKGRGRVFPHVLSIPRWLGCTKEMCLDPWVSTDSYIWIFLSVGLFSGFERRPCLSRKSTQVFVHEAPGGYAAVPACSCQLFNHHHNPLHLLLIAWSITTTTCSITCPAPNTLYIKLCLPLSHSLLVSPCGEFTAFSLVLCVS